MQRIHTTSSDCDTYMHRLVTEQELVDDEEDLVRKIEQLQEALRRAKEEENRLKVTNQRLTNMVTSSAQASVKKTENFVSNI